MGYIYVWEHFGAGQHIDVNWSPSFEDLYNSELGFRTFVWSMCFLFSFIGFLDALIPLIVYLRSSMSNQSYEIRQPLQKPSP